MSPDVTRRKLNFLIKNLDLLKKYEKADIPLINKNHLEVERLLHLIIEIMGDIDHHIIVKKVGQPPQSLKDSFIQMGNVGVLEQSLAKNLAPSAGLRNALIHMYEDIEIGFIQEAIKKTFQFVPLYIKQVEKSV